MAPPLPDWQKRVCHNVLTIFRQDLALTIKYLESINAEHLLQIIFASIQKKVSYRSFLSDHILLKMRANQG